MPRTPRDPAEPVAEAEQAQRVVAVLGELEDRLVAGRCGAPVTRTRPPSVPALIHVLSHPGGTDGPDDDRVADQVATELAHGLPAAFRLVGRTRPRLALALHDASSGDPSRTLELVRATHRRLGGTPRHPSARGRRG
jgi:hypothetical protein